MLTIILGVLAFTTVMVILTLVLLGARALLVPAGEVTVIVNDGERRFEVDTGRTLLTALADGAVFLPSACGGRGTCGTCRVAVRDGVGEPLPTDAAHLTRRELREGWRLACQVRLKGDLRIEIPPEMLEIRRWACTVRSNRSVATFIKELVLDLPPGEALRFRAGGYVQLEAPPHELAFSDFDIPDPFREAWTRQRLWSCTSRSDRTVTRAYSMANHPGEAGVIMLNVRIAVPPANRADVPPGVMSSYLFGLKPGDEVQVFGAFGDFYARDTNAEMVFIGGGAGMAPMRSHILDQFERRHTERTVSYWYGARSRAEAYYVDEFEALAAAHSNFSWHLALSEPLPVDRWTGPTGFIHQVVYEHYLRDHPAPEEVEYYLCGPPLMLDACRRMLDDLGVESDHIMFDDFGG